MTSHWNQFQILQLWIITLNKKLYHHAYPLTLLDIWRWFAGPECTRLVRLIIIGLICSQAISWPFWQTFETGRQGWPLISNSRRGVDLDGEVESSISTSRKGANWTRALNRSPVFNQRGHYTKEQLCTVYVESISLWINHPSPKRGMQEPLLLRFSYVVLYPTFLVLLEWTEMI